MSCSQSARSFAAIRRRDRRRNYTGAYLVPLAAFVRNVSLCASILCSDKVQSNLIESRQHRQGWFTYSYCHNDQIRQFRELQQTQSHIPGNPSIPFSNYCSVFPLDVLFLSNLVFFFVLNLSLIHFTLAFRGGPLGEQHSLSITITLNTPLSVRIVYTRQSTSYSRTRR